MTRCPNCKTRVDETFTFHCPECGTSVSAGVESMPVAEPVGLDEREPAYAGSSPLDPRPPVPPPPVVRRPATGRFARNLGIRALVVVVLLGGGAIYEMVTGAERDDSGAVVDTGSIDALELAVGDCIQLPGAEVVEFSSVEGIPCTQAHDAEVFALADHPATAAAPYPGEDAITRWSVDACYARFAGYVGRTYEEAEELDFTFFTPTAAGWSDEGDRTIQCLLVRLDGGKLTGPAAAA
jgi:hypothetical protein